MGEAERDDGNGSARRSAVGGFEVPMSPVRRDPVIAAIADYRSAMQDFNSNAPDDDPGRDRYALETYRRPLSLLRCWRWPATSRAGALEALRLALEAERDGDYDLVAPMVRSALAYVEASEDIQGG